MEIYGYEVRDGILDLSGTGLKRIESKAFLSSKTIRAVILPREMESIGDWAFAKCQNLVSVKFAGDFRPGLFGKDVFGGCGRLSLIEFADLDTAAATLLALCANKLPYEHLLRADDVGQKSWYEKWDIGLIAKLKSDDAEAKMSAALCGEEDISYDGIGSVDGEMSGETGDYVQKEEFNKCSLCYIRLSNDVYLSDSTRSVITRFIEDNRFGQRSGAAFYSIFEEGDNVLPYLRIYLDIVQPDKATIRDMIAAIGQKDVYAVSYLIKESGTASTADDLLL